MGEHDEGPSPEVMDRIGFITAQKNAMARGGISLPHGSRLFSVESGWESTMIARGENTAVATTLLELERALRTLENNTILIPLGASMTDQDIERLCQRNGVTRALYREVEKA